MTDNPPLVLDTMHAAMFHDRVYALMQMIEPMLCEHPMVLDNERIAAATSALTDAIANLYLVAGDVLMEMEDAEAAHREEDQT